MKFKFSIGWIIGAGFGVVIFFIIAVNLKTIGTLKDSKKTNKEIIEIQSPSVDALQELKITILNSKTYINSWVEKAISSKDEDKQALIKLIDSDYPKLRKKILKLSDKWKEEDIRSIDTAFLEIHTLFGNHEVIQQLLVNPEDYEDEGVIIGRSMIDEYGEITLSTKKIVSILDRLINSQRKTEEVNSQKMIISFDDLGFYIQNLGIFIIIIAIIIAFITIRLIVKPVSILKKQIQLLGQGIIPSDKIRPRKDEIGEMALALNNLVDGFNRTKEFASQVGSGNFHAEYKPLSDSDLLGHSLLRMRQDLFELTSDLEQKVVERTHKIEEQSQEIWVLLKHTTDSIKYAKRIQEAILPNDFLINETLPNSFFLYLPKDIVSGDFYWLHPTSEKIFFGAIDCTGHGVPGAFMTIIGYNALNKSVKTLTELSPAILLDFLNEEVKETFKKQGEESIKDGMDASICSINFNTLELEFASANNSLFYIREEQLFEIKGDTFSVGADDVVAKKFSNHHLQLQKNDIIYIFSDGYADQFGGPNGKKFKYNNFRSLLLSIHKLPPNDQKQILKDEFDKWKGALEQVDDILVIGLKI